MPTIHILCWIIALILFAIASVGTTSPKFNLSAAGLAFLTLGFLIQ